MYQDGARTRLPRGVHGVCVAGCCLVPFLQKGLLWTCGFIAIFEPDMAELRLREGPPPMLESYSSGRLLWTSKFRLRLSCRRLGAACLRCCVCVCVCVRKSRSALGWPTGAGSRVCLCRSRQIGWHCTFVTSPQCCCFEAWSWSCGASPWAVSVRMLMCVCACRYVYVCVRVRMFRCVCVCVCMCKCAVG